MPTHDIIRSAGDRIDRGAPLWDSLLGLYIFDLAGPILWDSAGSLALAPVGGPTLARTAWGDGLSISTAGQVGASALTPTWLQVQYPITMACGWRQTGGQTGQTMMASMINNTFTSPYGAAALQVAGGGVNKVQVGFQAGANVWTGITGSMSISSGNDYTASTSIGNGAVAIYEQGVQVSSTAETLATIAYGGTATLAAGFFPGFNSQTTMTLYWAAWWARVLTPGEHTAIGSDPRAIRAAFRRDRRPSPSAAASISTRLAPTGPCHPMFWPSGAGTY